MQKIRRSMIARVCLRDAPEHAGLRLPDTSDVQGLAALMLDAYRGTVDYEGESIDDAVSEVRDLMDGGWGPFLREASRVIELADGLASASLVIRWRNEPFVAFSMTRAARQRQGLARTCLLHTMRHLHATGETRLRLLVTVANARAVSLYSSLGFDWEPASRR